MVSRTVKVCLLLVAPKLTMHTYDMNALHSFSGAMSDVNSVYAGDDDVSISSRASSRLFDSDALVSMDSLNTVSMFEDSEYEFSDTHLSNLRSMTESIAAKFGAPPERRADSDSD